MPKLNREAIALNLLTCRTLDECAEKSGISKATLYRMRKNDPEFQTVLVEVKNRMFQDTMRKAQGYCSESLEVLRDIMNNEAATDSSRVSAAKGILELGLTVNEQEIIIQKIDDLERRLTHE